MTKPSFVYVTYIAAPPDKIWKALTDPEQTRQYWGGHDNVSAWTAGSEWRHEDRHDGEIDIAGVVLEGKPPQRLVVSWASPDDLNDPAQVSRVTYELVPFAGVVRLTVTHEELAPDSQMLRGVSFGWPIVLSSLKTFVETGRALPDADKSGWPRSFSEASETVAATP